MGLEMSRSVFPVRYLGIPLNGRTFARCRDTGPMLCSIALKLTSKVRIQEAKKLSYTWRLCMMQSMLCSIAQFQCAIFFLPLRVLHQMQSICKSYLQSSNCEGVHYSIAWQNVFQPRDRGSLGFKELFSWNKALLSQYVFVLNVEQMEVASLWV